MYFSNLAPLNTSHWWEPAARWQRDQRDFRHDQRFSTLKFTNDFNMIRQRPSCPEAASSCQPPLKIQSTFHSRNAAPVSRGFSPSSMKEDSGSGESNSRNSFKETKINVQSASFKKSSCAGALRTLASWRNHSANVRREIFREEAGASKPKPNCASCNLPAPCPLNPGVPACCIVGLVRAALPTVTTTWTNHVGSQRQRSMHGKVKSIKCVRLFVRHFLLWIVNAPLSATTLNFLIGPSRR